MKYLEERIKYFSEWIRLLWFAVLGLAGGISGLMLALDSPLRVGLFLVAVILRGCRSGFSRLDPLRCFTDAQGA